MQLKAAIAASLQEVVKTETNVNNVNITEIDDSDLETFDSDNEENRKPLTTTIVKSPISEEESCLSSDNLPKSQTTEPTEDYRVYLGPENGSKFELVVRYPDGNRENITFPSDSQLKVLLNLWGK